jgi:hypothetical protein
MLVVSASAQSRATRTSATPTARSEDAVARPPAATPIALGARDAEGHAEHGSCEPALFLFLLSFASNVFVAPATLPSWLQSFIDVNPISRNKGTQPASKVRI